MGMFPGIYNINHINIKSIEQLEILTWWRCKIKTCHLNVKQKCKPHCGAGWKVITKVSVIYLLGIMIVCRKLHCNPSNSYWDISVWNKAVVRPAVTISNVSRQLLASQPHNHIIVFFLPMFDNHAGRNPLHKKQSCQLSHQECPQSTENPTPLLLLFIWHG